MSDANDTILSLEHLSVRLPRGADRPHALSDVSLSIASNEILCVVGESGSGKSMMANAVMRLLPDEVTIDGGKLMFEGRDLCAASVAEMREFRGAGIAMIFQEPMTALNPLRTIGDQIAEMFSIHTDLSKAEISARVLALLADMLGRHRKITEELLYLARRKVYAGKRARASVMKSIEPARAVARLFEESWGVEADEDEESSEAADAPQEETVVVVETGTVAPATVTRTSHVA